MIECRDRLRELSVAAFGAFVADLAEREWAAWDAETAPPSPDGNVEICLRRGEERLFVHARHAGASGSVGRQAVRNLVSLQGSRGIRTAVLATNGDLSRSARREATVSEVEVLEPESLCRLASDHGVDPSAPPREPRIDAGVANEIAHYPDELRERATQLLTTLASFAQFERDVTRDEHGTTVTFSSNGDAADPVVRVRYEPSELRVYARLPGGEFDTLVRLSAARTEQPPMTDLEPVLRAGVDRALDVDGGR